jgi:SAM-dependent methyltransferase
MPDLELERVAQCPACEAESKELLHANLVDENSHIAPGRWTMWRCAACGSAFLDPRLTREEIGLAYRSYYTHDGLGHEEVSRLAALMFENIASGEGAKTLVDVGSGTGSLVLRAAKLGWNAEGLDPDETAVAVARSRGAVTTHGTAEALRDSAYDVVTMNHVIEHVHDPIEALVACRRSLRLGGSLWLATPNIGSLGYKLFGSAWYGLDAPRHLTVFSEAGLTAALRAAGFERLDWRPSVGLREARARAVRVLRHRRGQHSARSPSRSHDGGSAAAPAAQPASRRRQLARHPASHAMLRAVELGLPRTADELLVCAWRD